MLGWLASLAAAQFVLVLLALMTGQRSYAIRTLRVRDIDIDNGNFRLNPEAVDGLKGADKRGTWKSVLGSEAAVREWYQRHPCQDDPDAYFLTPKSRAGKAAAPGVEPISDDTVNRVVKDAAAEAAREYPDIEQKPTYAHMMRHNWVVLADKVYDLDEDEIKWYIGHAEGSKVMETTYKNLKDEDYNRKIEEKFGMRDEEVSEEILTPEKCDVCAELMRSDAKACPNCGATYAPDAHSVREQAKAAIEEQKAEAETLEEYRGADALEQLIEQQVEQRVEDRVDEKLEEILNGG